MIEEGDMVYVRFVSADVVLCEYAKVMNKPRATGDSWVFEEPDGTVHHVSEGCTITKEGES